MSANAQVNKIKASVEKGFKDIQLVLEEGNVKLFVKQLVVIVAVFLIFRYFNGAFQEKINNYRGQMEAIRSQKANEQEYVTSKKRLLELEPRFPDMSSKSEWLMTQLLDVFAQAKLTPQLSGAQAEDTMNPNYTLASLDVSSNASWLQFARLIASVENRPEYLRISEFSLAKQTEPEALGQNQIKLKLNTLFPKEKLAPKLFKNQGGK